MAVATAGRLAGTAVADLTPSLAAAYPGLTLEATEPDAVHGLDLVFAPAPRRVPAPGPLAAGRVGAVVDLAADFRLRDPGLYPPGTGVPRRP